MFIISDKTKCMIIETTGRQKKILSRAWILPSSLLWYIINSVFLKKLLGIKVDQQPNWESQVDVVYLKNNHKFQKSRIC